MFCSSQNVCKQKSRFLSAPGHSTYQCPRRQTVNPQQKSPQYQTQGPPKSHKLTTNLAKQGWAARQYLVDLLYRKCPKHRTVRVVSQVVAGAVPMCTSSVAVCTSSVAEVTVSVAALSVSEVSSLVKMERGRRGWRVSGLEVLSTD